MNQFRLDTSSSFPHSPGAIARLAAPWRRVFRRQESLTLTHLVSCAVNTANGLLRSTLGLEVKRSQDEIKKRERWLRSLGIRTVVDVGANTGQFATFFSNILPDAMIYSFEPLPDCVTRLELLACHRRNIRVFPYACGESSSVARFHRSSFSPSSSVLPMAERHRELFPFTADETIMQVEVRRLDDLLKNVHLDDNILVKLDVQGFEDRVIRGGRDTISRATVILTEVNFEPLYENQADFAAIHRALTECGFDFHGMWEHTLDKNTGCPLFGDALFTRRGASW
jgi:FkbM family methyltransferase